MKMYFHLLVLFASSSLGVVSSFEDRRHVDQIGLLKISLIKEATSAGSFDFLDFDADPMKFSEVPDTCKQLLDNFAQSVSNFTKCLVLNSRPVTICSQCVALLLEMRASYTGILSYKSGTCQHELLNRDRLMIVQNAYEYLSNIWAQGRCDNCFFIQHINGTDKYTLCNDTLMYYSKWNDVVDCLNNTYNSVTSNLKKNESIVCEVCQPVYLELNRYYESLNTKYSNLLCMDVMDLMNLTRHMWTKTYHCVQFDFNGLPVFILSGVMALIPLLFYGGNRIFSQVRDTRLMQQKRLSFVHSSFSSSAALQRDYPSH